jgi:hypothetical protein
MWSSYSKVISIVFIETGEVFESIIFIYTYTKCRKLVQCNHDRISTAYEENFTKVSKIIGTFNFLMLQI